MSPIEFNENNYPLNAPVEGTVSLLRQLKNDMATILANSIEKASEDKKQSAANLAADFLRFLSGNSSGETKELIDNYFEK